MNDKPHVLLVDDTQEITEIVAPILEAEGLKVSVADDGNQAIRVLVEGPRIDVVILDYMMPHMNGLKFLEWISQNPRFRHIKVILSSVVMPYEQDWWTGLGGRSMRSMIKGCVAKPFDSPTMIQAIRSALGMAPAAERGSLSFLNEANEEPLAVMPISEGKVRILVLDDDNVFGPAITEKLRSVGYGAGWCMTRETMMQWMAKDPCRLPFELLLLDLALPDGSGAQVLQDLARDPRAAAIRIVVITGELGPGEEQAFLKPLDPAARALVGAVLIKPYEWDALLKTVGLVLNQVP